MKDHCRNLYAVILAGGIGSRFWPLSRESWPKQLLSLDGNGSLLQRTLRLIGQHVSDDKTYVVTSSQHEQEIRQQLREMASRPNGGDVMTSIPMDNVLVEPQGRNTAAAIAMASFHLSRIDPAGVTVVLPADHLIRKEKEFHEIVGQGFRAAEEGYLVTLGIPPHRPETGFGYLRSGKVIHDGLHPLYKVEQFAEKPNLDQAKRFFASGDYFWNSGIFVWRIDAILREIKQYLPDLYHGFFDLKGAIGKTGEDEAVRELYKDLPSVSIDVGVMERSDCVAMLKAEIGWSDVGTWEALHEVSAKDDHGNAMRGNVVDLESKESLIYAGKRLVATIGLEKFIVVDTEDATLICPRDRSHQVKEMVGLLQKRDAPERKKHPTVVRPWGTFSVLEVGEGYKVKRVEVNPGGKLSLQFHRKRNEHWVVLSGEGIARIGDDILRLRAPRSITVPMGVVHRLENTGTIPLRIIEIQDGGYLGEDDIVRLEDVYLRPVVSGDRSVRSTSLLKESVRGDSTSNEG